MARRRNHYEAAFEAYLKSRRVPYIAVDETRRTLFTQEPIKSLDFIVAPASGPSWLADIKGRRFPSGRGRYWTNWSTHGDLQAMAAWEKVFGAPFQGLFVFAYWIVGYRSPLPSAQLWSYRDRWYAFLGVLARDYAAWSRPISPRWETVALRGSDFRRLARPAQAIFSAGSDETMAAGDAPAPALRASG